MPVIALCSTMNEPSAMAAARSWAVQSYSTVTHLLRAMNQRAQIHNNTQTKNGSTSHALVQHLEVGGRSSDDRQQQRRHQHSHTRKLRKVQG
jgi:hypothetical protein